MKTILIAAHIGMGSTIAHLMGKEHEPALVVVAPEEKGRGITISKQTNFVITAPSVYEDINPIFYDEKYDNSPKAYGMRKHKRKY
jgi:ribosomal protein S5